MTFLKVILVVLALSLLIGAGFYRTVRAYFRSDVFTDREDSCSTTNPDRDYGQRGNVGVIVKPKESMSITGNVVRYADEKDRYKGINY